MSDTELRDGPPDGPTAAAAGGTVEVTVGEVVDLDATGETSAEPVLDRRERRRRAAAEKRRAEELEPPREPWGRREWIQAATSFVVVAVMTVFTFSQLHPARIFTSAVPTGGDMGAHVWAPAYLRDHLLPDWRLSGWSMDWYEGLPVYRYYMLPPALLILLFDLVLPYGTAFKIVAVLGVLTLPVCAWAFGKLARFPFPIPALFSVAATIFLFDETFTILGGNIASTMAGEFSFSIALSLALLGLGVFARGMETGRHRGWAAVLIALAALCHGIVVFFVALGALLLFLVWADRRRLAYFASVGVTALLLAAFWLVPFIFTSKYMTDMKYEGAPTPGGEWNSYWRMFFPHLTTVDILWTAAALVGFGAAIVRRHRAGAFLGIYALVLTALIFLTKEGIPGFGLLWNVRLLPFLYLLRYMLALLGVMELVWLVLRVVRNERVVHPIDAAYPQLPAVPLPYGTRPREVARRRLWFSVGSAALVGAVSLGWMAWHLGSIPGQREVYRNDQWQYRWPGENGLFSTSSVGHGFVDGWADWNFRGYVGRPAYGEYRDLMLTMRELGAEPDHGCGRALWEHSPGDYGTTMALMLLPFWTDSCIGSSEGLYFEASATTPYHFLAAAALSEKASNPVRGLDYTNQDAVLGTRYLQTLGIRYYLAYTPGAVERASKVPDLVEIATSGPWHVYEVAGSDVVVPLQTQPVVVDHRDGDQRERWLEVGASWYQHPELWSSLPAADGPDSWQRVAVATEDPQPHPKVDVVEPVQQFSPVDLPDATVSDVRIGDESLSFDVDQVGVPVLVKVSFYPNWKAEGADGPYRVAPNFMVVIPTSNHVRLVYETTPLDYAAYGMSVLGLLGLLVLWRRGRVLYEPDEAWSPYPAEPDPFADEEYVTGHRFELGRSSPEQVGRDDEDRQPWLAGTGDDGSWLPPSPAAVVDAEWLDAPLAADPTVPLPVEAGEPAPPGDAPGGAGGGPDDPRSDEEHP